MSHNPPHGWTPGDTYGVIAHVDEVIGEGIASEADRPSLLPPFRGLRLCAHAHLDGDGAHWLAHGERCPLPPVAPEPDPTDIDQVRDYFRTVKADLDAEYPDPDDDELPDTDIRGAMAGELARMGLMPEQVAAHECTCPPPAAGGIVGVNRGHLLGCPNGSTTPTDQI